MTAEQPPTFSPLRTSDGSWQRFRASWAEECERYGAVIEDYAPATLAELQRLADIGHPRAEVYALENNFRFECVCQANCTPLPGFDGPVLRFRFITYAPEFDFGDYQIEAYVGMVVRSFAAGLRLSETDMPARHIKFHLRSPAERQFFASLGTQLSAMNVFAEVSTHGAWLQITKR
jgi:hypothetical protein